MREDDLALIRRGIEFFNRMLDPDAPQLREEVGSLWVDEPEIVPMRAALEGNVYRGRDALDRFREASIETWSELEVDIDEISDVGSRYLVTGKLRGRGRESGAEIAAKLWFVVDIEAGRVARVATYLDRDRALADLAKGA